MSQPDHAPPSKRILYLAMLGPGLAIAATGVGAGDMVAATAAGARYGYAVVWAAAVGALLKFVLNEGVARWQLATGTTLLEGWVRRLGLWVQYYFKDAARAGAGVVRVSVQRWDRPGATEA